MYEYPIGDVDELVEMIGIMLLGAWFLVHQHCCVAEIRTSSRSNLVDHLMRRSPLEKNFMRYGRSWPPSNFIASSVWQLDEKMDKPEKKGKTGRDIMRFGRSMWAPLEVTKGSSYSQGGSPIPRTENNEETFMADGKHFPHYLPEGVKINRSKKNFIRFGRKPMKESKGTAPYLGKMKGPDQALDEESKMQDAGYEKEVGDSVHDPSTNDLGEPKTVSYYSGDNRCACPLPPCKPCFDMKSFILDASSNDPELFKLLRYFPHEQAQDKRANNFIRLG